MNDGSNGFALTESTCAIYALVYGLAYWLCINLFAYSTMVWFGKDLPWYIDMIGGLLTCSFIIPVSVVTWIATLCGVATPFIGG